MGGEGKVIGDHWALLVVVAGGVAAMFFFFRQVMQAVDNRQHENMRLFFSNGGGELLRSQVKAGVVEALAEHEARCPQGPRIEAVEDRLITLERAG